MTQNNTNQNNQDVCEECNRASVSGNFWGKKEGHKWCNTCYKRIKRHGDTCFLTSKPYVAKQVAIKTVSIKTPKIAKIVTNQDVTPEIPVVVNPVAVNINGVNLSHFIPKHNGYISRKIGNLTDMEILERCYRQGYPVLIIGEAGTGKCVVGDTLIATEEGWQEIKDLENYSGKLYTINNRKNLEKVKPSHWYNLGNSKTIKITTNIGLTLEGTPEHPIKVLDSRGCFIFKELIDITTKDQIIISKGLNVFSNSIHITDEESYIAGLLIGDGYSGINQGGQFALTNHDFNICNTFKEFLNRAGINFKSKKYKNFEDIKVLNIQFKRLLLERGILALKKSYNKEFPIQILKSKKSVVVNFIRGLFDTDGWVDRKGAVCYSSNSKKLIEQLQLMLLNLGIVNNINTKKTNKKRNYIHYNLGIYGEDIVDFQKIIDFRSLKRKIGLKNLIKQLNKTKRYSNVKTIKADLLFEKLLKYVSPSRKKYLKSIINHERNCGKNYLWFLRTHSKIPKDLDNQLKELLRPEFLYLKPKLIENSKNVVYDFTVPKTHSFLANLIINHNTHSCRNLAYKLKMPYFRISLNGASTTEEIIGQFIPDESKGNGAIKWQDGILTMAVRNGGMVVLDEINAVSPEISFCLHALTDDEKRLTLTQKDGEVIEAHPNFFLVCTMNPDYEGTNVLNEAFKDRFRILEYKYDNKIEKKLIKDAKILELANMLRISKSKNELRTPISTRLLIQHQENCEFLGEKVAFEMFWNKFEPTEREAVKNVWEQISSQKLAKDDNATLEPVGDN